jgi:hypothetical protein
MKWWIWLIGYFAIGLVFWARLAYEVGMHYGRMHHGEPEPACAEAECRGPLWLLLSAFLLWPAFSVAFVVVKFTQIWTKAGSNSQLQPLNEVNEPAHRRTSWAEAQQGLQKIGDDLRNRELQEKRLESEKQIAVDNTTDSLVKGAQQLVGELRKGIIFVCRRRRQEMGLSPGKAGFGSVTYPPPGKRVKTIEGLIYGVTGEGEKVALTLASGSGFFVDLSMLPFLAEEITHAVGKKLLIRCDAQILDGPAPIEGKAT